MKQLRKIETSLNQLHNDFNKQLEVLGNDSKEFHNALIDLSAKYPDHKELLQFIVFINDKLETNQTLFSEIVVDSFNDLVKTKQELLSKLIEEKELNEGNESNIFKKALKSVGHLKDIKTSLIALAVILIVTGVMIAPDMFLAILKALAKLAS